MGPLKRAGGSAAGAEYGRSHFWVAARRVPKPNPDTQLLKPVFKFLPWNYGSSRGGWTAQEDTSLHAAILEEVQVRKNLPPHLLPPRLQSAWPGRQALRGGGTVSGLDGWRYSCEPPWSANHHEKAIMSCEPS